MASEHPFSVGDVVKCVDAVGTPFRFGGVYRVTDVVTREESKFVSVRPVVGGLPFWGEWSAERFVIDKAAPASNHSAELPTRVRFPRIEPKCACSITSLMSDGHEIGCPWRKL